jgi:nitrite reductase/ring-hydroxylating ferredoxin subunit
MPDQFLDERRELIVCATHAALFRIDDGRCIAGPCAGAYLRKLSVRLDGDTILLIE